MTLFQRIAWTGAAFLAAAAVLAFFVWRPANQRAFVQRTDGLLRSAEADFGAIATSLVDDTMEFAREAALAADAQRARGIDDLPLALYRDAQGEVAEARLKSAVRAVATDPGATGGEKHAAVRSEILARTRTEVDERLVALRRERGAAASRHGASATRRTLSALGGLLLLLLAGWAIVLDRVVLRPVRDVTGAIGRFGAGERGLRLDPRGAAELTRLATAFNETAAAVELTEEENAELRARLEEKVKERTAALLRAARASTAGTMAGGVAHEFNNLLGGILGCADAALAERPGTEVQEALEMIRKTATRGVGVTKALLRATRAEPERTACDPGALFEEALAEIRPPAGIGVEREFVPTVLEADTAMLRQVLANIVRNAVDAMGEEGTLRLKVAPGADEVVLEIHDTGPGIAPSVREILFEPFVTTRRGGREGAGLGLFLADRLVAAHGGRIGVASDPGGGTCFRIHFPSARHS